MAVLFRAYLVIFGLFGAVAPQSIVNYTDPCIASYASDNRKVQCFIKRIGERCPASFTVSSEKPLGVKFLGANSMDFKLSWDSDALQTYYVQLSSFVVSVPYHVPNHCFEVAVQGEDATTAQVKYSMLLNASMAPVDKPSPKGDTWKIDVTPATSAGARYGGYLLNADNKGEPVINQRTRALVHGVCVPNVDKIRLRISILDRDGPEDGLPSEYYVVSKYLKDPTTPKWKDSYVDPTIKSSDHWNGTIDLDTSEYNFAQLEIHPDLFAKTPDTSPCYNPVSGNADACRKSSVIGINLRGCVTNSSVPINRDPTPLPNKSSTTPQQTGPSKAETGPIIDGTLPIDVKNGQNNLLIWLVVGPVVICVVLFSMVLVFMKMIMKKIRGSSRRSSQVNLVEPPHPNEDLGKYSESNNKMFEKFDRPTV